MLDSHIHLMDDHPAEHTWVTDDMATLRRNFLPGDLQPLLRAAGMSGCVAVQARQSTAETDWLIAIASW